MKVLELFCGTKSFSKIAQKHGHETFTIDNDPQFNPDLCIDILDLELSMLPEKWKHPDFIWASPPCTTFSVASIFRYWTRGGLPKSYKTFIGLALVKKTLELIEEMQPKYWIIENPRGMLRKQFFMPNDKRITVTYCQYGNKVQKPTDLWNNLNHKFRPMCKPGSPCHEKASRGTRNGIQGINNSFSNLGSRGKVLRAIIPEQLCEEIICSVSNPLFMQNNESKHEGETGKVA